MMSLRHFSVVSTLNGRSVWRDRKWRFSVTNILAPVHSVYAAIKASAGFNPFHSYLDPNSNGTKMSSSIIVRLFINPINSLNSCGVKWPLTSSIVVRQIRILYLDVFPKIVLRRIMQFSCLATPKAKIYMFASSMNSKFFLPKFFSCFTQFFNNFVFCHASEWRRPFSYKFTKFFQMFLGFLDIFSFHNLSPQLKVYYKSGYMSMVNQSITHYTENIDFRLYK
jgi:hypothetical protein